MLKSIKNKKISVKTHIAVAVFMETVVNALFALLFDEFVKYFYSDYTHLTVWGDIAAIGSVVISFVIYDSFAHAAYHKRKDRVMFLGVVYVASKAASIIHYLVAILANIINADALELTPVAVLLFALEIAVDITAAVWLIGYFEKKFAKEE